MYVVRQRWDRDRLLSLAAVAAVHAAIGGLLFLQTSYTITYKHDEELKTFDVAPEPPPPPLPEPVPAKVEAKADEGAAAPPGLKAQASPVVVEPPKVRLPVPPPVVAAPVAGVGAAPSTGASDIAGPGTGAGGVGNGTGSGRSGNGAGGGGVGSRARLISGRMVRKDYPDAAGDAGAEGTVVAWLNVGTDGRVGKCRVVSSSGNAELDATTCRLAQERFRYEPARNADGMAVPVVMEWSQHWWIGKRKRR